MTWTTEEVNQLHALRLAGLSYPEIGEKLGKTKNACCARADRDGLRAISPARLLREPASSDPDMVCAAPPGRKTVPLKDLTATSCRWPFGDPKSPDFGFCGCEAVEGRPYCAEHLARAHGGTATRRSPRQTDLRHDRVTSAFRFDRWDDAA